MKIFVAVDMEGATGVIHQDQLMAEGRGYSAAQRYVTNDVLAVVAGIVAVVPGAEVVIGDGHATMRNIILDDMPENVSVVCGPASVANKPLCQMQGIDDSFDLAMCVGFHSMAGTAGGLLAHTYVGSVVSNWQMQGKNVGEVEVDAAIAGSFGVPLGLVVGNDDLESELRAWNTDAEFVATKHVLGPNAAICRSPLWTATAIREAAESAVQRALKSEFEPYNVGSPVTMKIESYRREMTDKAVQEQGVVRIDDRTFSCTGTNAALAFALAWRAITRAMDEAPAFLK